MEIKGITKEMLEKALNYVEATEVFLKKEAPLYVQELLSYGMFEKCTFVALWFVFFVAIVSALVIFCKRIKDLTDRYGDLEGLGMPAAIVLAFSSMVLAVSFFSGVCPAALDIYKINYAPRVYLIEKLRQ